MALVVIIVAPMDVALRPERESEITAPELVAAAPVEIVPRWRLSTRIAFRFCFVYFGVYILVTQMLPAMNPIGGLPVLSTLGIVSRPVMWVIRNVFHDTRQLAVLGGSGDKMFDWVFVAVPPRLLRRPSRWSGRCSIAGGPITSGCTSGSALWVRFARGDDDGRLRDGEVHSAADVGADRSRACSSRTATSRRWACSGASIGASFPYERVVGSAELLAAVLLFVPFTATLGGIVRARRQPPDLHAQHDVRRAGEAVLVSPDSDVALHPRAGHPAAVRAPRAEPAGVGRPRCRRSDDGAA